MVLGALKWRDPSPAVLDEVLLARRRSRTQDTKASTFSPHFSSGTPMTATSATASCW